MAPRTLAYLDPGNGTMILQMIAGAVAAGLVMLKLFWRRILRALHLGKATPPAEAAEVATPPAVPERQVQDR